MEALALPFEARCALSFVALHVMESRSRCGEQVVSSSSFPAHASSPLRRATGSVGVSHAQLVYHRCASRRGDASSRNNKKPPSPREMLPSRALQTHLRFNRSCVHAKARGSEGERLRSGARSFAPAGRLLGGRQALLGVPRGPSHAPGGLLLHRQLMQVSTEVARKQGATTLDSYTPVSDRLEARSSHTQSAGGAAKGDGAKGGAPLGSAARSLTSRASVACSRAGSQGNETPWKATYARTRRLPLPPRRERPLPVYPRASAVNRSDRRGTLCSCAGAPSSGQGKSKAFAGYRSPRRGTGGVSLPKRMYAMGSESASTFPEALGNSSVASACGSERELRRGVGALSPCEARCRTPYWAILHSERVPAYQSVTGYHVPVDSHRTSSFFSTPSTLYLHFTVKRAAGRFVAPSSAHKPAPTN